MTVNLTELKAHIDAAQKLPLGYTLTPGAELPDLDTQMRHLDSAQRDLLFTVLTDVGEAVLTLVPSDSPARDRLSGTLARVRSEGFGSDRTRGVISSAYGDTISAYDRVVRALRYAYEENYTLASVVDGFEGGRWEMSTREAHELFAYALKGRSAPKFFDLGVTIDTGRVTIQGVTYDLTLSGGKPVLTRAEYPRPEAGQTWASGEARYLITTTGMAVNLSSAELVPLTEGGALKGTERGVSFTRVL